MGKYAFFRKLPKSYWDEVAAIEKRLGVPPVGTPEREDWSHQQMEIWRPWTQGVNAHRWRFVDESPCLNCGQLTTCMEAGPYKQTLCLECMNTGLDHYPTSWATPNPVMYVRHSEKCTLHSQYPTSSHSMHSERESLLSRTRDAEAPRSTSTSSSPRTAQTARTSSPDTRSSPSGSLKRMSLNSSTRRN